MNKFDNLPSLFFSKAETNLENIHTLKINSETNQVQSWKWSESKNLVLKILHFLEKKNLSPFDRVLLVSENRPEWMAADIAIMSGNLIGSKLYYIYTKGLRTHTK